MIPLENIAVQEGLPEDLKTDTPNVWTAPRSIQQQRIIIQFSEEGIAIDRLEVVSASNIDVVEINDDIDKLILVSLRIYIFCSRIFTSFNTSKELKTNYVRTNLLGIDIKIL